MQSNTGRKKAEMVVVVTAIRRAVTSGRRTRRFVRASFGTHRRCVRFAAAVRANRSGILPLVVQGDKRCVRKEVVEVHQPPVPQYSFTVSPSAKETETQQNKG